MPHGVAGPELGGGRRNAERRPPGSGEVVGAEPLTAARDRHAMARAELPDHAHQLSRGEPVIPTVYDMAPVHDTQPADSRIEGASR